jgi:hypothetical protein
MVVISSNLCVCVPIKAQVRINKKKNLSECSAIQSDFLVELQSIISLYIDELDAIR